MFHLGCLRMILNFAAIVTFISSQEVADNNEDILQPYLLHHGPLLRRQRDTQKCQSIKYGNVTYSLHQALENSSVNSPPVETSQLFPEVGKYWNKRNVVVHHQIVNDPLHTLSILEPGYLGSCLNESGVRATVSETARRGNCVFASNAGFFNTKENQCLGNVVSDGKFVHNSKGIQNANFGITTDGKIFTGYLSELDYLGLGFQQLIGGVIWLVRDKENYVEESVKIECPDIEETGTLRRFADVISSRTAFGHDEFGRVHIVQVNGITDRVGVNLNEFADLLISLGIVNAINFDGGGSTTTVVNHTLVNVPGQLCPDNIHSCERSVSTVLCVHYTKCSPPDCSGHGMCDKGQCQCQGPWMGDSCDVLDKQRCGPHGTWVLDGCSCKAGWHSINCSIPCSDGWYGPNCVRQCLCGNHSDCDVKTGECHCHPGYIGTFCRQKCPYGFYGQNCMDVCFCQDSCFCDHVTGSCNISAAQPDYIKAGDCLVKQAIEKNNLVPDRHEEYSLCIASVACLSIVAIASLLLNAVFTYLVVQLKRGNALIASSDNTDSTVEYSSQGFKLKRFKRRKKRPKEILNNNQYSKAFKQGASGGGFDCRPLLQGAGKIGGGDHNDDETVTGSGESENDLFIARKKTKL